MTDQFGEERMEREFNMGLLDRAIQVACFNVQQAKLGPGAINMRDDIRGNYKWFSETMNPVTAEEEVDKC